MQAESRPHLGLLQGGLQLQLLHLQLLADLLQLMDILSSFSQLLSQVGDFLWGSEGQKAQSPCSPWTRVAPPVPSPPSLRPQRTLQVLVLPLVGLQVLQGLLVGVLELEELRAERARLLL